MDTSPNSLELVDQCVRGDRAAAEAIYEQHAPRVMVFFLRSGFLQADAEDLTQEVFFRAMRSLKTFRASRGSLGTWLAAIARNTARRHWARRKQDTELDMELVQEALVWPATPEEAAAAAEQTRAVNQCLQGLPRELANLLRLRYVKGLSTRGVSQAAKMSEATVRARLDDAITRMTKCLKNKGFLVQ